MPPAPADAGPPGAVRVPLRVRFGETDAVGVANNAVYLSWFEVARIEYLRALGRDYADVHRGGVDLVVTEAQVRYRRPLRFDDAFEIAVRLTAAGRASCAFAYVVEHAGAVAAEGVTRHAAVDSATMRPTRLPGWVAELGAPG